MAASSKPGELQLGAGAGWALLAGLGSGFSNPCIRQALVHGAEPMQVFAVGLGLGLIPAVLTLGLGPGILALLAVSRWKTVLFAGLLCFGSYGLFLIALQAEGAALGTTLRNASIAFALVLAWATGQKPTARQWVGGTAVMAGASLLALKL
jgi:drug/metabolite transporter (DMT)-like permease